MPIDRTVFDASIDDSGSGTDGTIGDKAWYEAALLDPIDDALTGAGSTTPGASGDIYEKGRTTALGHWIDVPFNAANFSVLTGSGTWTVGAGAIFSESVFADR